MADFNTVLHFHVMIKLVTVCDVKLYIYLLCTFLKLVSFGLSNEMMVTFKEENTKSLKHLFLKGYEDQDKNYAVYTSVELYEHLNYIINQVIYFSIPFFFCIFMAHEQLT